MRRLLGLMWAVIMAGYCTNTTQAAPTDSLLKAFQAHIDAAREDADTDKRVGVLIGTDTNTVPPSILAFTRQFDWDESGSIWVVFVSELLLREAPQAVLRHIAYHEVCHVVLEHRVSLPTTEHAAEQCASRLLGRALYEESLRALQEWLPIDQGLRAARDAALATLQNVTRAQ